MKKTPTEPATRQRFKSSMSISQQVICEDDACIGRQADRPSTSPTVETNAASDSKRTTSDSITVGGKPACEDEACIGKK
jgi:hypothetical protein